MMNFKGAGGMQGDEVDLDQAAKNDLITMFRNEPSISSSRQSYLATTLSSPFTFYIPKMGLRSKGDMDRIIERHWMPWLRKVYDWTVLFGICPYYFERRNEQHQIPVVPDVEMGDIRVFVNHKTHRVEYKWYWNHGTHVNLEKKMLWVITDRAPTRTGEFRSVLASLIPRYRTILILRRALQRAATQNTSLSHILEYHPSAAMAKNDDLTQMVANFGEKAAGLSKARQELARAKDIRVRTDELMQQVRQVHMGQLSTAASQERRLLWTDTSADVVERMDSGLDRMVPLRPDFKYVSPARASVVAELEKYQNAFDVDAAAAMGYAYELIRPTGAARTQNVRGGERFVNERSKEGNAFFTVVAHSALIIAYDRPFREGFSDFQSWHINRQGGDQHDVAELHPEMDVEVYMSSTPMTNYDQLRQMWQDGILRKEDFANHAFEMNGMPIDQVKVSLWPDMVPKELLIKPQTTKPAGEKKNAAPSEEKAVPPKKKQKKMQDEDE
jgi:hypothetical protein